MVAKFETSAGRCIYTFQVEAFPTLIANIYVIDDGNQLILIDCGSGMEKANREFLAGFEALRDRFGVSFTPADVDLILISHGHIDHFGGLTLVREYTDAPVAIHRLDRRVLSHYEERRLVASRRLERFLEEAGVSEKQRPNMMQMYLAGKDLFHSWPVQFLLEEGEAPADGIDVYHVPGHCPGQVCLRVDDVLLTADHILAHITPHQAPESITLNTGLGHYLESLDKIARLDGIRLALGGHEAPMEDVYGRIAAIKQFHQERLQKVLDICSEPRSVREISRALFGEVDGYHVLLALEETGAHVEYLYLQGELTATNLEEIASERRPVILYQRD